MQREVLTGESLRPRGPGRRGVSARVFLIAAMLVLAGSCSDEPPGAGSSTARLVSAPSPSAPVMAAPSGAPHLPPAGPAKPVSPVAFPDLCPDDKPLRSDWPALVAAKQKAKWSPAVAPQPKGSPSAELLGKQQAFLSAVEARKALFATLAQEELERQYSELKRSYLGE